MRDTLFSFTQHVPLARFEARVVQIRCPPGALTAHNGETPRRLRAYGLLGGYNRYSLNLPSLGSPQ